MARKTQKTQKNLWGLPLQPLLLQQLEVAAPEKGGKTALVHIRLDKKQIVPTRVIDDGGRVEIFLNPAATNDAETDARLSTPLAVRVRDAVGASLAQVERLEVTAVEYAFDLEEKYLAAALLGLELALYRFKRALKSEPAKFKLTLSQRKKPVPLKTLTRAAVHGLGVNLARHLINLPPNLLNPVTYAEAVQELFSGQTAVQVEVWDEKRLAEENMNLHLAVGQASRTPPRLVHIRYRPTSTKGKAPLAFVGKGITFDSGGLDIKPSSGMRLMKKDMGGSAAVLGLAFIAVRTEIKKPMDFYLALAENSIGDNAFRPSDIFTARNGQTVEIHNTDAEGRLVLADAMDVAAKQKEKPSSIIDVATLTGAIKVALGSQLAGLFSNDTRLAQSLNKAGQEVGDLSWIMPLYQRYRSQMNTVFADQVNAVDGFGGAITAALFLEKFSDGLPWAHLDIYAWKDSADGAWLEAGGSGQAVLGLAHWLMS